MRSKSKIFFRADLSFYPKNRIRRVLRFRPNEMGGFWWIGHFNKPETSGLNWWQRTAVLRVDPALYEKKRAYFFSTAWKDVG